MVNMISLGIVTLFQNPSQLHDLKSDASLVPAFVEELCRYHTASSMATRRVAKADNYHAGRQGAFSATLIGNHVLLIVCKAGEGIIAATQSGNQDEEVFQTLTPLTCTASADPSRHSDMGLALIGVLLNGSRVLS
ncbi:hypothetical protein ACEPPN_019126 [Leptodophora sp. 'Broadleaf-Isolate-01']